jgi:hypothetical protein
MRLKTKGPAADSATILTLWASPDDLWERVEWLLDKFDPPKFRGRKRAPARLFLDGLVYHFRTGCQWNQTPKVYGDVSTIHRAFQRWVRIGLFEMTLSLSLAETTSDYFSSLAHYIGIGGCARQTLIHRNSNIL